MHVARTAAGALAAAAILSGQVQAQTRSNAPPGADISALRQELDTMRHDYETRIHSLEERLAKAEADAAAAKAATDASHATASPGTDAAQSADAASADQNVQTVIQSPADTSGDASAAGAGNPNIYNPGMAVVLNGFYSAADKDTGGERIAGIPTGADIGNPQRGFSLGESEIGLSSNIDPYFYGFMVASIDRENSIGIEEAYIQTTQLPAGLTLTAGRFFSGIGYQNEQHAHNWAFADAPLPYRAFLNTQLGDDGVQLTWLAPTNQFLLLGAEAFRGDAYPAASARNHGAGTYTAFVRTGSDIDVSNSYLASISYAHTQAQDRPTGTDLFSGDSNLWIGSLTYKWAPNGNRLNRNFTGVAEIFAGAEKGSLNGTPVDQDRTGWYVQGVYQYMPRWKVGLRYAAVASDTPGPALAGSSFDDRGVDPYTATALLEWDPSEFSRLRLQYSRDESDFDPNNVLTLQYTVIYGLHGAHRY